MCFSDYMHVIRLFSKQTSIWLLKVQIVVWLLSMQRRIIGRAKKIQVFSHQQVAMLNRKKKRGEWAQRNIPSLRCTDIYERKKIWQKLDPFSCSDDCVACTWFVHEHGEDSSRTSQRFLGQFVKSSLVLFNMLRGNELPRARRQLPIVHASTAPKGSEY